MGWELTQFAQMLSKEENQLQTHTAFALRGLNLLSQRLLQRRMLHMCICLKCILTSKGIFEHAFTWSKAMKNIKKS